MCEPQAYRLHWVAFKNLRRVQRAMDSPSLQSEHRVLLLIVLDDLTESVRCGDPDFKIGVPSIDGLADDARLAGLSALREHLSKMRVTWAELASHSEWMSCLVVHLPRVVELELAEEQLGVRGDPAARVRRAVAAICSTAGVRPPSHLRDADSCSRLGDVGLVLESVDWVLEQWRRLLGIEMPGRPVPGSEPAPAGE